MAYVKINGIIVDEHAIYDLGYNSAQAGLPESSNPFPEGSYSAGVWSDGWYDWDANDREEYIERQTDIDDMLWKRGVGYAEEITV